FARLALPLLLVILKFTKIHNTAYRRIRARCHFNQIKLTLRRHIKRRINRYDPNIFTVIGDKANLAYAYLSIYAIFCAGRDSRTSSLMSSDNLKKSYNW